MNNSTDEFISKYKQALAKGVFVKLSVANPRKKDSELKKLSFQLVELQNEKKIKCVYTNQTNDITKNYTLEESSSILKEQLEGAFKNATLFTTEEDLNLLFNKKMEARLMSKKASFSKPVSVEHNKTKKRLISPKDNQYFIKLGVTNQQGKINKNKVDKFKQINKYIETVDGIIKSSDLKNKQDIKIVDMGSGKGYLTFALYDYLHNTLGKSVQIVGVEQRPDLVSLCNSISKECKFEGLSFELGSIDSFKNSGIDILIALHACDTATDDAIYSGIQSKASIIITAPCCHKQVRKEFNITNELKEITQFGILEERQAEILTDTIRALSLEAEGYKSQVFEFIADAHTHKNVMLVGTRKKNSSDNQKYIEKIDALKNRFGVDYQHLEKKIRE